MKQNVIWNVSQACPWSCSFCCVGALYVKKDTPDTREKLKSRGQELSLEQKLAIVDNLDVPIIKMDFSGGEPLHFEENRYVLERVSEKLGRENMSVTATGKGLAHVTSNWLRKYVSDVGFTYDFPREPAPNRPYGYNKGNLDAIRELDRDIHTMAHIPITVDNSSPEIIDEIYTNLMEAGVDDILLIDFFPSGRGDGKENLMLSRKQEKQVIAEYRAQSKRRGGLGIKLVPCLYGPLVSPFVSSFNIDAQGILLSNPWSYYRDGRPHESRVMGDLKEQKFSQIAGKNAVEAWINQWRANRR